LFRFAQPGSDSSWTRSGRRKGRIATATQGSRSGPPSHGAAATINAEGGSRTPTSLPGQRILNPSRLPIPPLRPCALRAARVYADAAGRVMDEVSGARDVGERATHNAR